MIATKQYTAFQAPQTEQPPFEVGGFFVRQLTAPSFLVRSLVAFQRDSVTGASTAKQFHELVNAWNAETMKYSSPTKWAMHPAYRKIIRRGNRYLPLIMEEFEKSPSRWEYALQEIAGYNVAENAKSIEEFKEYWRAWARPRLLRNS